MVQIGPKVLKLFAKRGLTLILEQTVGFSGTLDEFWRNLFPGKF